MRAWRALRGLTALRAAARRAGAGCAGLAVFLCLEVASQLLALRVPSVHIVCEVAPAHLVMDCVCLVLFLFLVVALMNAAQIVSTTLTLRSMGHLLALFVALQKANMQTRGPPFAIEGSMIPEFLYLTVPPELVQLTVTSESRLEKFALKLRSLRAACPTDESFSMLKNSTPRRLYQFFPLQVTPLVRT